MKIQFKEITTEKIEEKELVEILNENFQTIAQEMDKRDIYMFEGFKQIDKQFVAVKKRLDAVEGRLDNVEKRLGKIERRLEGIETSLDIANANISIINNNVNLLLNHFRIQGGKDIIDPDKL